MHDISPVLAGTFDSPDYVSAKGNVTSVALTSGDAAKAAAGVTAAAPVSATSGTSQVDPRRYTKFDRSAADAGSTTSFTFSDFLDAINPLQHIPVISSIYREATGETINPISRVTGDMAYGGIFGLVSVATGGIGAVADSIMEAQTGKDMGGYVTAALFGDEATKAGDPAVQLASAASAKTNAPAQTAVAQTSSPQQTGAIQLASAPQTKTPNSSAATDAAPQVAALNVPGQGNAKFYPLDRSKMAYGGVMAPVGNMQDQNLVMALSEASHNTTRLGNTIYTSPLMNGAHPLPVAAAAPAVPVSPPTSAPAVTATARTVAPVPAPSPSASPLMSMPADAAVASTAGTSSDGKSGPRKNPIPQALTDDMVMMKALDQYKNVAGGGFSTGTKLDVTN